jgi:DNA-binding transcriptional LysR family regulator
MNLQQLEYFLQSARGGSFSAAADELHLAQPSVSEQVRRLEAELGVRLFQRVGRGLVLTEAGKTLQPRAEAVLDAVREARESVVAVRELRGGTASFGTFGTADQYLGSDLIAEFRERHPNVRVRILGLNSAEAADDVREGGLEAAIVALPVDDEGLSVRPVVEDELCFVSSDPGRLGRAMTIERLAGVPLILPDASYRRDDPTRRMLAELAQRAGVTLTPIIDVESETTAFELAGRGVGDTVAWLGLLANRRHPLPRELGWTTFKPSIHMWLAFIFRRGAPLSPSAREMSAIVEERLLEIAQQLEDAPKRRLPGE